MILIYLLIPLITSLAVLILKPLSDLIVDIVVLAAGLKLKVLKKDLLVIGITGSYGKTSLKEILAHLLAGKFSVCKTAGTNNTLIGVALTILRKLNRAKQIFIVEMGAYRQGEIKTLCRLVKPDIGILTGITIQHLGLFGSLNNIIRAKAELLDSLPKGAQVFLNGENQFTRKLSKQYKHLRVYLYRRPQKNLTTNLLGSWQQLNLNGALAVGQALGIKKKTLIHRMRAIPGFPTALLKKSGINHSLVLDNSFSANPTGFKEIITDVHKLKSPNKILVTSGIIELGMQTISIHKQLGKAAGAVFRQIYVTKKELLPLFPHSIYLSDPSQISIKPRSVIVLVSRLPQNIIQFLCPNQS
jgi:UDP-N-acetylmuramoyl-tripeptide--D-alanyl-D-alanine ligase